MEKVGKKDEVEIKTKGWSWSEGKVEKEEEEEGKVEKVEKEEGKVEKEEGRWKRKREDGK